MYQCSSLQPDPKWCKYNFTLANISPSFTLLLVPASQYPPNPAIGTMGNNSSNSVLHNIDSVVTRLAGRSASSSAESPTGPNSSDDPETVAARRLVCEVLRASVKEMLRQQLRAAAVRAPPRSDQAELLQAEAERLVAGVLEAAIDVLAEELV
uniref:Uncharacterized protein n=1 Tax=Macrostomum lignano TaxID=282301 RepID=A0A1I8HEM6_9PLAT